MYNPYNFYEELSKTIIKDVQNILKNNKIKSYVWSIRGPIMDAEYVIRLDDMINIIDILEFKELTTGSQLSGIKIHRGGHATEEGNKFIGELINKACINMKI